jgi:uncharacterized protein (DUF849 family)
MYMHSMDDSLLPENHQPRVIQAAPYGPQWLPGDSDDVPVTTGTQVQKAVDCYNAGARVLHVQVREADGKGDRRMFMFSEVLDRPRTAVPKMVLQKGVLKLSHLVRHSQYSHFNLEIHHHELP